MSQEKNNMKELILYHGTFEQNYKKILNEGFIENNFYRSDATKSIDECLNYYGNEGNLRGGAIFLFDSTKYTGSYDNIFTVSTKDLNLNYLYIADFQTSTDIYDSLMRGKEDDVKKFVKAYENSFMRFEEYLKKGENIITPEFLYFDKIPLDIVKVVSLDDIIDDVFKEYEIEEPSGY
jgi:hypothetical protein